MGSGDLNAKKSWHVVNVKNQKKVWESEQNALAERKKVNERLEELRKERQEEELAKQLEEAGGKRRVDRVDWMYQGPGSGDGSASMVTEEAEAFLLGKRRIDTLIKGDEHKQLEKSSIDDRFAGTSSLLPPLAGAMPTSARDMATKIREDPLLAIKRQEQQAYEAMANDPVRRRQMMAAVGLKDKERDSRDGRDGRDSKDDKDDRSRRSSHHHRSSRYRDGSRDRRRARERERTRDWDDDDERRHKRHRRDDGSRERRRNDSRDRRRRDSRDRVRSDRDKSSRRDDRRRERSPRATSRSRSQSPSRERRDGRGDRDRRDDRRDRNGDRNADRNGDRNGGRGDYRTSRNHDRSNNNSNAADERARKLAAMQANASELDTERSKRLAEIEAKEAAARAADEQARDKASGSTTAFSTNLRQKVGDMGLADRLGRNRQGLQRDEE